MILQNLDAWRWLEAPVSTRLCLTLLHSVWQIALLALFVAWIARRGPRRSSQSGYLSAVGAMLCGLLLLPITYLAMDPPYTATVVNSVATTIPSDTPATPATVPAGNLETIAETAPSTTADAAVRFTTRTETANASRSWQSLTPWAAGLYVTGVAWMLLRLVLSTFRTQRLRAGAELIRSGPLYAFVQSLSQDWSMQVVPQLAIAEQVMIPKVIGLVRPVILLPAAALSGLSTQQLEMILAHELAHVRRYDVWVHLTQRLAEAVLFFNPALWYLSRRISLYREYCCDELACETLRSQHAANMHTEPRTRYALALLRVVELAQIQTSSAAIGSLAAGGRSPSELRHRIARLLGEPLREPIRFTRGAVFTVVGVCVLLASPVIWPTRAQAPPRQDTGVNNRAADAESQGEAIPPATAAAPTPSDNPPSDNAPSDNAPSDNAPATISGRIILENGEPATTTGWMYYESRRSSSSHQGTDDQYTDQFACVVPAGKIWLSYYPEGYAPTWAGPFDLEAGETQTDVTLVLKRGFSSVIQIRNQQGDGIAGATLNAHPAIHGRLNGPKIDQVADESGNLKLEHLADTRYYFHIEAPGYQPLRTEPLTVAPDKTLVQTMRRAQPAEGTVLNADGTPAAAAKLRLVHERQANGHGRSYPGGKDGFWGKVVTETDPQGNFQLDQLTPGSKYLFVVQGADEARGIVHDIRAGRQNIQIALPPRRDLVVRILGDLRQITQPNGEPSLHVRQRVHSEHSALLGGTADITANERGGTAVFRGLATPLDRPALATPITVRLGSGTPWKQTVELNLHGDTQVEMTITPEQPIEPEHAAEPATDAATATGGLLNQTDRYQLTALSRAAEQGQTDVVQALLEAGALVDLRADGYTALMRACIGNAPETAKILLEAGAEPNLQRHDGQSALHFAAKNGSLECAKWLLQYGADPSVQTAYKNWTPRHWAQHYKHQAVVDLLDE